jgi:hypothetical protein
MNALVAQASAFWSKANAGITLLDIYLQGVGAIMSEIAVLKSCN